MTGPGSAPAPAALTGLAPADDLALALTLAAQADLVSLPRFRAQDLVVEAKPDRTPVTDADRAVEQAIRSGIAAARPGDAILGEEFGEQGDAPRRWIVDPIDGTANFLRGVPIWGTLIALAIDGVPVLGVASMPALGRRWWGMTGAGAWAATGHAEPERLRVSGVAALADAVVSYNSLPGWDEAGRLDEVIALTRAAWRSRAIGDLWPYLLLAEGAVDVVGEFDLQPYDMAALAPIVREAGGTFGSVDGDDTVWAGSALATNGLLRDEVLAIVGRSAGRAPDAD